MVELKGFCPVICPENAINKDFLAILLSYLYAQSRPAQSFRLISPNFTKKDNITIFQNQVFFTKYRVGGL